MAQNNEATRWPRLSAVREAFRNLVLREEEGPTCVWKNLAPALVRQRLIIEGTTKELVMPEQIAAYLLRLAEVTKMTVVQNPITSSAHEMGYSGWIHWKTSGANVYSYPAIPGKTSRPLVTVDCYTCKPFDVEEAVRFTREFFEPIEMVWMEVEV